MALTHIVSLAEAALFTSGLALLQTGWFDAGRTERLLSITAAVLVVVAVLVLSLENGTADPDALDPGYVWPHPAGPNVSPLDRAEAPTRRPSQPLAPSATRQSEHAGPGRERSRSGPRRPAAGAHRLAPVADRITRAFLLKAGVSVQDGEELMR